MSEGRLQRDRARCFLWPEPLLRRHKRAPNASRHSSDSLQLQRPPCRWVDVQKLCLNLWYPFVIHALSMVYWWAVKAFAEGMNIGLKAVLVYSWAEIFLCHSELQESLTLLTNVNLWSTNYTADLWNVCVSGFIITAELMSGVLLCVLQAGHYSAMEKMKRFKKRLSLTLRSSQTIDESLSELAEQMTMEDGGTKDNGQC